MLYSLSLCIWQRRWASKPNRFAAATIAYTFIVSTAIMLCLSDLVDHCSVTCAQPAVLANLREIFSKFEALKVAPIFVLMGDFASAPINHTSDSVAQVIANFDALGQLIAVSKNVSFIELLVHY